MITAHPGLLFAGILDLTVGILLLYTETALPGSIELLHSGFLIYKGAASIIAPMPIGGMPVYVLGSFADVLSAALLYFGQPPILIDYKNYIAIILFFKGSIGILGLLSS